MVATIVKLFFFPSYCPCVLSVLSVYCDSCRGTQHVAETRFHSNHFRIPPSP
jgi:hypothetical protein